MAKSLRVAYGETLVKLGAENENIVALDADIAAATMTCMFRDAYPDRFYNCGIAEANMVGIAAGMAQSGLIPFVSTFAMFGTGRAYEQIRNSVAYTHQNVKFALSHSGISVGEDGGSHQAIEDISLMRGIPGMTIFVPCDPIEMEKAVRAAVEIDGPVYIRTGRPVVEDMTTADTAFIPGKANVMKTGSDVCIIANGLMIQRAMKAAEILEAEGISVEIANMHTVKPIDEEYVIDAANRFKVICAAEEHSIIGGLCSAVAEVMAGNGTAKYAKVAVMDKFGKSGSPDILFEEYGLTAEHIVEEIKAKL